MASSAFVKVTSPGPVLYRSQRIGLAGEPFRVFKFRTMYCDADKYPATLLRKDASPLWFRMPDDPRITPVGKFLRWYSLDPAPAHGHRPPPVTPAGDVQRLTLARM